ncbi:hypothetical protein ACLI4Z_02300 [Natrialbaceae archaeon A-arb3/5]
MTPELPEPLAESWQSAGTRTGETSVLVASITAETTLYEPVDATGDGASQEPLDEVVASKIPPRSLFVVDLTISPSLPSIGVSPAGVLETAAPKAKSQFVDLVEGDGLAVEGVRDRLEFEGPTGDAGIWYVMDMDYSLDSEQAGESAGLRAEAHVAVWPTETTYGVAGGILPLEATDGSVTAPDADPERDRETISELVRTLELDPGESDPAE